MVFFFKLFTDINENMMIIKYTSNVKQFEYKNKVLSIELLNKKRKQIKCT